jgi:mannitol/fructose-specific phosphotransferase system IIA component (Ntr-type)
MIELDQTPNTEKTAIQKLCDRLKLKEALDEATELFTQLKKRVTK